MTTRGCVRGLGLGIGLAAMLVCVPAHADFEFQFATTLSGAWLRRMPAFSADPVSTSARDIESGRLRSGGSLAMMGIGADADLTIDDKWKVPLLGLSLAWSVGSYDAQSTSFDGSIATLKPWKSVRGDILLPGIGYRWKHRRNMVGIAARTGVSFLSIAGSVAAGAEAVPLNLSATTFLVQVELEGCRRLDPTTRLCLQVVPRVYEHEMINGLTFGLRMEWGR